MKQVIDCILWRSRARRQMFFSATAGRKRGAGLGRTTQRDELFMASLRDTTKGGMDDAVDGRMKR